MHGGRRRRELWSLPGMSLPQVSTYSPPSPPSGLSSGVTSGRPPFLVTLFKTADLQPHQPALRPSSTLWNLCLVLTGEPRPWSGAEPGQADVLGTGNCSLPRSKRWWWRRRSSRAELRALGLRGRALWKLMLEGAPPRLPPG